MSRNVGRSAGQATHHDNLIQIDIPVCTACATNMCCRSNFDGTIEAAGRNLEQCAIHLDIRERRPALDAEAALMPGAGQPENFDLSLSGYPIE